MALDCQRAEMAFALFIAAYEAKYPKATELLAFYDFPAEHWGHIRTANPIESTFATVHAHTGQDPRRPLPRHDAADGVQTVAECRQAVASITGRALPAGGHERHCLQGWSTGRTRHRV